MIRFKIILRTTAGPDVDSKEFGNLKIILFVTPPLRSMYNDLSLLICTYMYMYTNITKGN